MKGDNKQMSDKIIVADGLREIDEEALKFCLSCEGDVYYHALSESRGKKLLHRLLSVNKKCNVIEISNDELNNLLKQEEISEVHIFYKKRRKTVAIGAAVGIAVLLCGIAIGKFLFFKEDE